MSVDIRLTSFFGAIIWFSLALILPAGAAELINKDAENLALRGYDTVAYFTEGKPVEGTSQFEFTWRDATWRFASASHQKLFSENPQHYAPRYGGFCAGAMARGWKAVIDPAAWVIIDDKLYLNYAKHFVADFKKNSAEQIPKATVNWERLGKAE